MGLRTHPSLPWGELLARAGGRAIGRGLLLAVRSHGATSAPVSSIGRRSHPPPPLLSHNEHPDTPQQVLGLNVQNK